MSNTVSQSQQEFKDKQKKLAALFQSAMFLDRPDLWQSPQKPLKPQRTPANQLSFLSDVNPSGEVSQR